MEDNFTDYYRKYIDNQMIAQLMADPDTEANLPNKRSREVFYGHYVLVKPTPLHNPHLIRYSKSLASELKISEQLILSDQMIGFLSGAIQNVKTWATPYALSIYGEEMISNCPFGTGNGYGDGRVHSIGEFFIKNRWEFQLKGSGKTPFSRSGDGRAVLRSSVREYLASEAMHWLNVPTTRALSLICSRSEKIYRPWYGDNGDDNKNCANGSCSEKMVWDWSAICCRVSPSFIRIGHLELFGRRARENPKRTFELEQLFRHSVWREYPQHINKPLQDMICGFLVDVMNNMCFLVSNWLRVGFVQSNLNSDNCLIGGRTMDYGPFGFIELYDPKKNFWVDGGEHFSFMNQPIAIERNFESLVDSLRPLIEDMKSVDLIVSHMKNVMQKYIDAMWKSKLGLVRSEWNNGADELFKRLEQLLRRSSMDWTMFWRKLSMYPLIFYQNDQLGDHDRELDLSPIVDSSYRPERFVGKLKDEWLQWLRDYHILLRSERREPIVVSNEMKKVSPKYIPREWMLVRAYQDAKNGNYEQIRILEKLFTMPYDEQPEMEIYYMLQPLELVTKKAGTAYMTCSS
jgi:uncharacterized protein YdiU (UPF0061 family)